MLAVLRTRGYNLFCNVLTTSDLYFDLLTNFLHRLRPTDSSLFALDMTSSPLLTSPPPLLHRSSPVILADLQSHLRFHFAHAIADSRYSSSRRS
ncbi:Fasciclin-like arabinogalactan protein 19 [Camellia lanceoleosa]|uniref:Fasciclin-like arabinogalactan protein 19 n=1 Tax=Camellia lanceoleosa TaxID=1840588 RepID=A0ACC0H2J4_9ERIC|nr:Fasciclin-like arabinogalactan protein 19 [Camellia lanceoleosa]